MKGFSFCSNSLILFFSLFLSFASLSGQELAVNESVAIQYFKEGNYEKALPLFYQLFKNSPDNGMYNYYYGVTLLKNNHYETATKEALLNAVVDNTPSNVNFYLGNYFQALENWREALDFYERYKGSDQERKALEFDRYVSLCRNKINPFAAYVGNQQRVFIDTIKTQIPQPDEKNFPIPAALKTEWFVFQVNSQLTYHRINDFKSEAAKILFTKAWLASGRNDSIVAATDALRKAHDATHDVATRLTLVQQIVDAEQQSYQLVLLRDKFFEQARVKESAYWEKAGETAVSAFMNENEKREKAHDSLINVEKQKSNISEEKLVVKKPDTAVVIEKTEPVVKEKTAPKENIIFKVQIGSFLNGKLTPAFKTMYAKLSKLRKIDEYVDPKKFKIFTIGNFVSYTDATTLKNQLILEGVKGAFVVAYKNGEKVPVTDIVKIKPANKPANKKRSK
jgi:tetratricopeptide (TPR) repeat protein